MNWANIPGMAGEIFVFGMLLFMLGLAVINVLYEIRAELRAIRGHLASRGG